MIGIRATVAAHSGRYEDALELCKRAYRISQRSKDLDSETVGAQNIAVAYKDLARPVLARRWALRALKLAERVGTTWRREEVHRLLGLIALDRGDLVEAAREFESARVAANAMDDSWRAAALGADIGAILIELDDPRARSELDAAYEALSRLGDNDWLQRIDLNRARLAERSGDRDGALLALRRLADTAGNDPRMRCDAYERIATAALLPPINGGEALSHFRSALDVSTEQLAEKALLAGSYAHRLQDAGCLLEAMDVFDDALALSSAGGNTSVQYDVQSDRALLLVRLGNLETAVAILEGCVTMAARRRDRERHVRALHNLGETARRAGALSRSTEVLRKARDLAARAGDEDARRSAAGLLAITQISSSKPRAARKTAEALLACSEATHDDENVAVALGVLGSAAFLEGDYVAAAGIERPLGAINAAPFIGAKILKASPRLMPQLVGGNRPFAPCRM